MTEIKSGLIYLIILGADSYQLRQLDTHQLRKRSASGVHHSTDVCGSVDAKILNALAFGRRGAFAFPG